MIRAKVICDSISTPGYRLTTFEITCHRFILAEINTHRVLSRNYRSSRAVPSEKLIEEVRTNPAMPVYWGKNKPGMQAKEELSPEERDYAKRAWLDAATRAVDSAELLAAGGLHKQIANRVLEPFLWVHGVVTATEWANFFGLRLHKDAQPEFRVLAEAMWRAYGESKPRPMAVGQWHLPYTDQYEFHIGFGHDIIKQSVARCCRVSYKPFDSDKPSTLAEDLALYYKLVGAQPMHASPLEHQATPDYYENHGTSVHWAHGEQHGNFDGWRQYRKMLPGESRAPLPEEYRSLPKFE